LQDLGVRNREMVLAVLSGGDAFRQARADIEDYGLAISRTDSEAIEQANDRIGRLGLIGQYAGQQLAIALVPAMGQLAQNITDSLRVGGLLRGVIDGLVGNVQTLAGSVAVLVGFLGVKLVVAMAVSAGATSVLSGALILLRKAIFATGFGALIIGAGWVVGKFADLVKGAGGFGAALGLLSELALEVWGRIKLGFVGLEFQMAAGWLRIKADAIEKLGDMAHNALVNANTIVGAFVGAKDATVAAWGALPAAFANIGARAVNALIDGLAKGVGGIVSTLNALPGIEIDPPDFSKWRVVEGKAADLGGKAKAAFNAAMGVDYSGASEFQAGIAGTVSEMRAGGDLAADFGVAFKRAAAAPLKSLGALKDAVSGTKTEVDGATDNVEELGAALDDVGGSGAAVDGLKNKVSSLKDKATEMKDTFRGAFKNLASGAKSFGEVVQNVLSKIADKLLDNAFDNLWSGFSGGSGKASGGGFLSGLLGSIFPSAKGNVFSKGSSIKAFAKGGVVNAPTFFPMSGNQTGLMGEAGPEAIVPLSRGANGKLGIASHGGGGGGTVQVIGGDLVLTDNGTIMARVQILDSQNLSKSVGATQKSFKNSKTGWSP
jgi:hypothetical protein